MLIEFYGLDEVEGGWKRGRGAVNWWVSVVQLGECLFRPLGRQMGPIVALGVGLDCRSLAVKAYRNRPPSTVEAILTNSD